MKFNETTEPKCASAKVLKSPPHPSLLRVISRKGKHPGRGYRIRRWHRYQVGMSVLHCRETPGLDHLDIGFYEKHGLMTLRPMTPEERREALRRWDGNSPTRDGERTSAVTREVSAAIHLPVPPRALVEATKPKAQTRTPKNNIDWDVNPATGKRDSLTYEQWRGIYDRKKYPSHDREWKMLKLGFKFFVVAPLTILGALGLFSGQKE